MTFEFLKRFLFSLRAGSVIRIIAWLSLIGTSISVMALVVVISVMNGFGNAIQERLLSVEPHIVLYTPNMADALKIDSKTRGKSETWSVFESRDVIIRTIDGLYSGGTAKGLDAKGIEQIWQHVEKTRWLQAFGNLSPRELKPETTDLAPGEVLIGSDLANMLAIFPGDEVVVVSAESLLLPKEIMAQKYQKVRVKSVLRTNVPQIDSQLILYRVGQTFRKISSGADTQQGIEIRLEDPHQFTQVMHSLRSLGFRMESWADRNSGLFFSLKLEKMLMGLFLSLTLLVGSFSVVILMVLLAAQKKKEMGILQAMGMSPAKLRRLFTKMGVALGAAGCFLGSLLGLIVCYLISETKLLKLPEIYYENKVPVKVEMLPLLGLIGSVLVICYFMSWLVTRSVVRVTVVESLRSRGI